MKSPSSQWGYTIAEAMFFLTISAGLFVSVNSVISNQNKRTEFSESVQTFNQRLIDSMNDVSTGYFPSNSDFSCSLDGSGRPVVSTLAGKSQGQNEDCVFAGKVFQFYPNEGQPERDPSKFKVYTLIGARVVRDPSGSEQEVTSVEDAKLIALDSNDGVATVDSGVISASTEINKVIYKSGLASGNQGGGYAVLSGFAQNSNSGSVGLKSGNIRSSLAKVPNTSLNQAEPIFLGSIALISSDSIVEVKEGVLICLKEPGDNGRRASILVGGSAGQNTTQVSIDNVPAECTS